MGPNPDKESIIFQAPIPIELRETIPIFTGVPPEPIKAFRLEISKGVVNPVSDVFTLIFWSKSEEELERLQFDTLDTAFDQAQAIVGIRRKEWARC